MRNLKLLLIPLMFFFVACGGDDDSGTVGGGGGNNTDNGVFGQLIDIPNVDAMAGTGYAINMRTTNEGIYMHVALDDDTNWIYRLQQGGPSPDWIFWEQEDLFFNYHPTSWENESPDELSVFFMTVNTYGYAGINTDLPAFMEEDSPVVGGFIEPNYMIVDNSPQAYTWAAFGDVIQIKGANQQFEQICILPSSVEFMEADPNNAVVWAASGATLYKVTASGDVQEFDVSAFHNPDYFLTSIKKVRFSDGDVFFNCEDKIFRITNGGSLSMQYQFTEFFSGVGPDFAVDGSHIFTSQGDVVNADDGDVVANIIPEGPEDPTDFDAFQAYLMQVNAFRTGQMEVSTDPLNPSIYVLANDKVLIVPKKRFAGQY